MNPNHDYAWVERTITVDAIADESRTAIESNPGWKLIGVGKGTHEQTTLTYGWPWPGVQIDGSAGAA